MEYGEVLSVEMVVQTPAPAGERWKVARATPELASAELDETVTAAPETLALEAGAVSEPLGAVESLVKVKVVAADELPALSVEVMPSVGELDVPSVQVNALVVT